MGLAATAYASMLRALLPPGRAWDSFASDSVIGKVLLAISDELARVDGRAEDLVSESDPRTTDEMLEDWERILGLPDDCVEDPTELTTAQRRLAVVQKLIARGGQSPAYFTEIATTLGITVTIDEFQYTPFRSGSGRSGDPLYGDAWAHAWTMNVPLTGRLSDSSGNARDLTETGSVGIGASTVAAFGKTAAFTAAGGYLTRDGTAFDFSGVQPFTVEFFVTPNNIPGSARTILGRGSISPATVNWQFTILSGGQCRFQCRNSGGTASLINSAILVAGTRYHFAGVFDGSQMRLYKDGVLAGSTTPGGGLASVPSVDFAMGYDGANKIYADVDEVRISNVARYTGAFTPTDEPFTTDANTLALYHFGNSQPVLECIVERAAPAHTQVLFNYEE